MKVSWQVTGIRKDPWAKSNHIKLEEEKASKELGYYLNPELYNKSPNKSIQWARYPEQKERLKEIKNIERDMRKKIRIEEQKVKDMRKKIRIKTGNRSKQAIRDMDGNYLLYMPVKKVSMPYWYYVYC